MNRSYILVSLWLITFVFISAYQPVLAQNKSTAVSSSQFRSIQHAAWKSFAQRNSNWMATWDERTGMLSMAVGPPISSGIFLNNHNIEEVSRQLLVNEIPFAREIIEQLELEQVLQNEHRWFVNFVQRVHGVEVLGSEIALRLHERGDLVMFSTSIFPDVNISHIPSISEEHATTVALQAVSSHYFNSERLAKLYIQPYWEDEDDASLAYRLIYRVDTGFLGNGDRYEVLVDAHHGNVIYSRSIRSIYHDKKSADATAFLSKNATTASRPSIYSSMEAQPYGRKSAISLGTVTGVITGDIYPTSPYDAEEERPFANMHLVVGGDTITTDANGAFEISGTGTITVKALFHGPYIAVYNNDTPSSSQEIVVNLDTQQTLNIHWDDSNSLPEERNAFYHINLAHDFIKTLDPSYEYLDFPLYTSVNDLDTSGGFYHNCSRNLAQRPHRSIELGDEDSRRHSSALVPGVIYHEYGHALSAALYNQNANPDIDCDHNVWTSTAAEEGLADIQASMIMDIPLTQKGNLLDDPDSYFTNYNDRTKKTYPAWYMGDNLSGPMHESGIILGGAFWDIREERGGDEGLQLMRQLVHFSRYGLPHRNPGNPDNFARWFREVLFVDDDNGDLTDGTPNFEVIKNAFSGRGIGLEFSLQRALQHGVDSDRRSAPDPALLDTQDSSLPYVVDFEYCPIPISPTAGDINVIYTTDRWKASSTVQAQQGRRIAYIGGEGPECYEYQAEIPPQPAGTVVRYRFSLSLTTDEVIEAGHPFTLDGDYSFLVGYTSVFLDDFEMDTGWSVGAPDDDATAGIWERAIPQRGEGQLAIDHTPGAGQFCFVTGPQEDSSSENFDIDGGKTTLHSPLYDLTQYDKPVISLWHWFTNDRGAWPGLDPWQIDLSNDGGITWYPVLHTTRSSQNYSENYGTGNTSFNWQRLVFKVEDVIEPTETMRLRFIASDYLLYPDELGSFVEAMIDDFEIHEAQPSSVATEKSSIIPDEFALLPPYPNPFSQNTTVRYEVPNNSFVSLRVFDMLGREVMQLLKAQVSAGRYEIDFASQNLAPGIYVIRLESSSISKSRQVVIL